MIIHDIKESDFDSIVSKEIVLVDFFATWCGPCKMLAPELEMVNKEMQDLNIVKIDVDKYQALAEKHSIMSVPTLLLYYDGKLVNTMMGYMPSNELVNWIKESIK